MYRYTYRIDQTDRYAGLLKVIMPKQLCICLSPDQEYIMVGPWAPARPTSYNHIQLETIGQEF